MRIATILILTILPAGAHAFCGFFVSGGGGELYNEASLVVLMRDGKRTVIGMQNDYQGPVKDFAMVIPVPMVLQKENVKTLPREIFAHLDQLTAPRLVEYHEQDPCNPPHEPEVLYSTVADDGGGFADYDEPTGVKVEARFSVAEFDIVVLSAEHSSGLETWLIQNAYNIPAGAAKILKPYVEANLRFLVAKVDVTKVKFEANRAVLSPLRFHFDASRLMLPIQLGMINSAGEQDLIVHVLARGMRYEVANYDNFPIPTNLVVDAEVAENFGAFYRALFAEMQAKHPGAVITEYAWGAGACDPCPGPVLTEDELVTLGADVIPSYEGMIEDGEVPIGFANDFVVTRLHLRYRAEDHPKDLVFRPAPPINGGGGTPYGDRALATGAHPAKDNRFQGRYIILRKWEGEIACDNPQPGIWGPPVTRAAPSDTTAPPARAGDAAANAAVGEAVSSLDAGVFETAVLPEGEVKPPGPPLPPGGGCAGCAQVGLPSLWILLAFFVGRRRSPRN